MSNYKYHTVESAHFGGNHHIVATQKYTLLDDGKDYYLGSFDYAVFEGGKHLIATGTIQGLNQGKIDDARVIKVLERVLEGIKRFGN